MRGFARVSVAVPVVRVGAFDENLEHTLALFRKSHARGDALVAFPELESFRHAHHLVADATDGEIHFRSGVADSLAAAQVA